MKHACLFILLCTLSAVAWNTQPPPAQPLQVDAIALDRSPVDLVLTANGRWLITCNQTSSSLSLIDTKTGAVVDEVACGSRPSALALSADEKTVAVTGTYSGDVHFFTLGNGKLSATSKVFLNYFEPRGVVYAPNGKLAYIALTTAHEVAVVDVAKQKIIDRISVGRWPRSLAINGDGTRLAVGANGDGGVSLVDLHQRKMLFQESLVGINLGQMHIADEWVYLPWTVYLHNPVNVVNIENGWVLANRLGRVNLNKKLKREAIALDPKRNAVADPTGLAISPDGKWLVCGAAGTGELIVCRLGDLPLQAHAGPGDFIHPDLHADKERFDRIPLGGRPMFLRFAQDGKHVYVANYLLNAVQVVDVSARKVVRVFDLGGPKAPSLARQGEAIFFDARRTLDHWFSCHTCHFEGHTNAVAMDTNNDDSTYTFKTVLSLRNVTKTGPWTWHGKHKSLDVALQSSLTDTMQGKAATKAELQALTAFLETLSTPPSPHRHADGSFSEAAKRGEQVFHSKKANCVHCHQPPHFTSDRTYDVGLGGGGDRYPGYNPPSLLGLHTRLLYLHDGRSTSLEDVLRTHHNPAQVTGKGELTEQELQDLLAYLKSL